MKKNKIIYLDNAATSWPKPPGVAKAMSRFMGEVGANPGRSGHRLSVAAARLVYQTREELASLFGIDDPLRVIFGINVTDGLNLVLHGLLKPGDHVIVSSMEHNAVMRPLNSLKQIGVEFTKVECFPDGSLEPSKIEQAILPKTRLIVLVHGSNVCGTILPVHDVGKIARQHDLLFMVDSAQTAGLLPLDLESENIDFLAFTGHKSLYGPMGTGGVVMGKRIQPTDLLSHRQGGTGSRSSKEIQPEFFPDRFESGTCNAVGITGLLAALRWRREMGTETILAHEQSLCAELLSGLNDIFGIQIYGPQDPLRQTPTVAFNINGMEPSTAGQVLDERFGILCRIGLHCAPSAHETIGTYPNGCIRFGIGAFNTKDEIQIAVDAIRTLVREHK